MFSQGWPELSRALAAGGRLAMIGCLLLGVVATQPIRGTTVVEAIVALLLAQGLAVWMMSGDVSVTLKVALANLIAFGVLALRWWAPLTASRKMPEPVLVFHRGQFIKAALRRCGLSEEDVFAPLRVQGVVALRATDSVVVSPDGTVNLYRIGSNARPGLHLVSSKDDAGITDRPR